MMTEERKGEIALMLIKLRFRTEGMRLGKNTRRELGNTAKDIGIPFEEAVEFAEGIARELMVETFSSKREDAGSGVTVTEI